MFVTTTLINTDLIGFVEIFNFFFLQYALLKAIITYIIAIFTRSTEYNTKKEK